MSEEPFLVIVLEAGCLWDCGSTHGRSKRFFCSLKHWWDSANLMSSVTGSISAMEPTTAFSLALSYRMHGV